MSKILKINKGLITQKINDKLVIFDSSKSSLYTLNETAAFIFRKIKNKHNQAEIVTSITEKYKVSYQEAKKDLEGLLKQLQKQKIISTATG